MIFAFLALLIGVASVIYLQNSRFKTAYCFLIGAALVFISGLRSEWVGTDTHSYVEGFYSFVPGQQSIFDLSGQREFLFYLYRNIVRSLTGSYAIFLFLPALFYIWTVCRFINRHSSSPVISFLLFLSMGYYSFSMAGIRQTIAIGFLILATEFLLERKFLRCGLLILVAAGFHITSLVYLLVILLYFLPLNKWFIGMIALLTGVTWIGGERLVFFLVEMIWGDSRSYKQEFGGISTLLLLLVVSVATLLLYRPLWKYRDSRKAAPLPEMEGDLLFTKMLLFSVPFQLMAVYQANAFRIAMLFHFPMIVLLPNVIAAQEDFRSRVFAKLFVVFCLLYQLFFITYFTAGVLPYSFFWQS